MEELPHIAALSAEKQFINFMEEKNFKRNEITPGRYKTLIGFGMLFNRTRKLVGTKNGREYPSIIGDSSVGMATAIYAMAYLQYITKGCVDYWDIYNYKYNVCESMLHKRRHESQCDKFLKAIIVSCWKQLSIFGKFSVQEQTKKLACWEFVMKNVQISDAIKKELKRFTISKKEKDKRDSDTLNNEDHIYFEALGVLLSNNANKLIKLYAISLKESEYRTQKTKIANLLKKIKSSVNILPRKRVESVYAFYNDLADQGFEFNSEMENNDFRIELDIETFYDKIFKDKKKFFTQCEDFILEKEDDFEENNRLYEEVIDITEKYQREYGLSINDLYSCQILIDKIQN